MAHSKDRFSARSLAARAGSWDGSFEQLESRTLLTGMVNGVYPTEVYNWHGSDMLRVRDSWLLTFDQYYGTAGAMDRVNQVAAALGVTPESGSIQSLGRGHYARFSVPGVINEARIAQVTQQLGFVRGIEPEGFRWTDLVPNDAQLNQQWAILNSGQNIQGQQGTAGADISATLAWDLQTGSRNVVVAVLDTGIDPLHPDLHDNIWTNPREIPGNGVDDDGDGFIDDVQGWDFAGRDNNATAGQGNDHGVAVSGVIGALGNNGIGVTGVAWNVSILPVKIFSDMPGGAALGDIIDGIDYTTMLRTSFGVNIVCSNNSYGAVGGGFNDPASIAEQTAIQSFTDSGALFIASAGNSSSDNDNPQVANYPASYDNPYIISVAATDNQDQLAGFSSFGATTVDLGAPGVNIRTTALGGGYQYIDGTSFSSPYTAGVVALLASASPFADKTQLKAALLNGVDPDPALAGRCVTGGRLNANASLRLVGFPGPIVLDINPGATSGPVDTITVGFSKDIDPAFFAVGGIELRAANQDNDFNANDIFYSFASNDVSISGSILTIHIAAGNLPIDSYRLTLRAPFFRDFNGNFLNGTASGGNDQVYDFRIIAGGGPLEPNDSLAQATPVIFGAAGTAAYHNVVIGDGNQAPLDVDIYRLTLGGPGLITAVIDARSLPSPSTLDSYVRLFDASGRELAHNDNFFGLDSRIQFFVPAGGRYFIGVSGFGNATYNPGLIASGTPGESQGAYDISFQVTATQPDHVTYGSSGPGLPIPTTGTITSTIFIPDIRKVQDVNVRINIAHTFIGDLQIQLISPAGTVVNLVMNRGGSSSLGFVNTVFDDQATTAITAGTPPYTGSFRPEGLLSAINNQSAAGNWTLRITDTRPLNGGTLNNWSLDLVLQNSISGPFEFNDTLGSATDTGITQASTRTFDAAIGDGAFGQLDVDLYKFIAPAGTTVTATITLPAFGPNGSINTVDTVLRLFDQQGNQIIIDNRPDANTATITFPVQFAGTYYIGVSGAPNAAYDPDRGGSGVPATDSGSYSLTLAVVGGITNGAVLLQGQTMSVGIAADGSIGPSTGQNTAIALNSTEFLSPNGNPAGVETFYGATFGGFIFRNSDINSDLPVTVTNESDFSNRRVEVEGLFRSNIPQSDQGGGLLVRRSVSFGVADQFIAVDVALTNTTFGNLDQVAWLEGFRPQQAMNLGSVFTRTINNVDNGTSRLATASYFNSDFPGGATIGIAAPATASGPIPVLSVETPGTVRDPFQVIGSNVDPDPSVTDHGTEGDGSLAIAYNVGTLDAGTTVRFRYFIFVGPSLGAVQTLFTTLNSGAGAGHLVADAADPNIPASSLPYALYYPEGYANSRSSTFLPLVNPHDAPAHVVVIAHYENTNLAPVTLFNGTLDPNSRGGITITTPQLYAAGTLLVQKDTPYAIEVKSSLPVGATLSHFDFGIATGQAFTSQPSTVWTFSEGFKGAGVNDFLVYYNPSNETVKATLTIYLENSSQTFVTTETVGPQRRLGWDLSQMTFIPQGPFAMKLEAEGPIVAALTHFDSNLHGGFSVLGLPNTGSTEGVSPEGQVGLNATNEFVTVLNQGDQDSTVTFTFFFANQSAYRRDVVVPARHRGGFNVAQLPGFPQANQPYSIGYESDHPVTVTLSSFAFGSATGTRFSDDAKTLWLFSDGFKPGSGNAVTEYLRLFNPLAQGVTVKITLDFADVPASGNLPAIPAGSVSVTRVLTGRAANDFNIHDLVTGDRATRDVFYSLTVEAPTPVVAYTGHFDAFFGGGFGTLGTALGDISAAII